MRLHIALESTALTGPLINRIDLALPSQDVADVILVCPRGCNMNRVHANGTRDRLKGCVDLPELHVNFVHSDSEVVPRDEIEPNGQADVSDHQARQDEGDGDRLELHPSADESFNDL